MHAISTQSTGARRPAHPSKIPRARVSPRSTDPSTSHPVIQAKLRVGPPQDRFEQEADRAAERVMRMPAPGRLETTRSEAGIVQRTCAACQQGGALCAQCADEEQVHRQPVEEEEALQCKPMAGNVPQLDPAVESQIRALQGGGQPLPSSERAFFEPRFGVDFSQIRIHTGAQAAQAAAAIQARAFTIGSDIAFAPGEYRTSGGPRERTLIAHELAHTIQQGETVRRAPVQTPRYTAQPGDSLSKIAGFPEAGWEAKLQQIIAANPEHPNIKGKVPSDPQFGWLEIGDQVTIPWGKCPAIPCPFAPTQPLRAAPTPGVPPFPQRRTPTIASGGLCRGACGPDCPDSCVGVGPITTCHYDAASGCHAECEYTDVISCYTHQGCRVHDDCYDQCAQAGEMDLCGCPQRACLLGSVCPPGVCHCACDTECCNAFNSATCGLWAMGNRRAPTDGEFFYTDTVTQHNLAPGSCVP